MQETHVVLALGALAHGLRLRVFRHLVVAGPQGMIPSVLSEHLDIAPNALSFHLKGLARAGLVEIEPQGRNLIYRAHFQTMAGVMGFLTDNCCSGESCAVSPTAESRCC